MHVLVTGKGIGEGGAKTFQDSKLATGDVLGIRNVHDCISDGLFWVERFWQGVFLGFYTNKK